MKMTKKGRVKFETPNNPFMALSGLCGMVHVRDLTSIDTLGCC